jgi:hypothetical protein
MKIKMFENLGASGSPLWKARSTSAGNVTTRNRDKMIYKDDPLK